MQDRESTPGARVVSWTCRQDGFGAQDADSPSITTVLPWWYRAGVKGNYNFTLAGLRNAEQHGITPAEVWQVLQADRRVIRTFGENSRVIVGVTDVGRYIAVMVQEDPNDDEDTWDVVAARDLPDKDVPGYERLLRRRP